jgi:amino acid transporter
MGSHTVIPSQSGLARRRLGVVSLFFFTVAASAPMTVVAGGVTTTFAVTGVTGVPLSYLVLAVALALFVVGYAAMSRYVTNAGAFYSYIANGLGRSWGVSASFVALLAYNAIQIGLYGLFGFIMADFVSRKTNGDVNLRWWVWALIALVVVGLLGILRIDLNAKVLSVLLIAEIAAVIVFDVAGFTHPAGGVISTVSLEPKNLAVHQLGAVLAFGIAAYVGFESGAIYSEECKNPRRTVARATYLTLAFCGLLYAASAWAMTVVTGPENVVDAATKDGPGVVFGTIAQYYGDTVADGGNVLFITSVFAALLSFHNGVARYFFAMGRERVLPRFLGRTGARSGAPVSGSLLQSLLAIIVVAGFVIAKRDPLFDLFTWLSGIAAAGVVLLMATSSLAVIGFFWGKRVEENVWQKALAPALGAFALFGILVLIMLNFDSLIAGPVAPPEGLRWILPGFVLAAAVIGLFWGVILRSTRPDAYSLIGRGAIDPSQAAEPQYVGIRR